jgi:hypothetical protein
MKKTLALIAILCTTLFAVGLVTRTALNQTSKMPAYTIVWQETVYDASGRGTPESVETKYVSASGNSYSIKQYADGKTEEMFSLVGRGVFLKRGNKAHFLSDCNIIPPRSAEGVKNKNHYLRTDTVLGQTAIVINPPNDSDGHLELFFAPALNTEIKSILHGPRTIVKEPVSLIFGEPDPKLFRFPVELPVDYSNYERLHGRRQPN